ncbi:MAG: response regulator, partial [Gammaproteobacteria bacterium]|nr:response regulator [Gammaproteobacteria bacterium]
MHIFEQEKLDELKQITRTLAIRVALPLFLLFWILDLLYAPEYKWEFLSIRLMVIPLTVVILMLLKISADYRQTERVALLLTASCASAINFMIYQIGPVNLYSIPLNLVAIAALSFIPWTRRYFFYAALSIYVPYISIELARVASENYAALSVNGFFLMGVVAITWAICEYRIKLREKEFLIRTELEAEVERRKQTEQALVEMRDQALAATNAKSLFLANMSHELRTPLTSVIGFSDILNDKQLSIEEIRQRSKVINKNAKHLLQIINDILDLSKIEANQLDINKELFSLFDITSDIENLVADGIQQKGLEFDIRYQYPLPESIYTDQLRIKQILINLCGNALKFTEKGFIHIGVEYDKPNNKLLISVEDSGIGVSKDQIEKIFDAFNQADSSVTKKYGGTGLGLSITRELVSKLGGELTVKSELKKGSCFQFSFNPGKAEDLQLVDYKPDVEKREETEQLSFEDICVSGRILLVEDVVDNQVLISNYLEKTGASVDVANNGEEALEILNNKSYDLVLMDMQMPKINGLETVSILRKKDYVHPIVMLTGNAFTEEREQCKQAGCDDFLMKPIDKPALVNVISRYLSKGYQPELSPDIEPVTKEKLNQDEHEELIFSSLLDNGENLEELVIKFTEQLPEFIDGLAQAINSRDQSKIVIEV